MISSLTVTLGWSLVCNQGSQGNSWIQDPRMRGIIIKAQRSALLRASNHMGVIELFRLHFPSLEIDRVDPAPNKVPLGSNTLGSRWQHRLFFINGLLPLLFHHNWSKVT